MTVTALALLGVGAYLGSHHLGTPPRTDADRPFPPVLTKVQALGELHSAKYTYENVGDFETRQEPEEWAKFVPGATSLVHWATSNKATASYKGTVEAGVDLGKVREEDRLVGGKLKRTLILPNATMFEPQVTVRVSQVKDGLMWRDNNLVPSAEANVKEQYRDASLRQGILALAEQNAAKTVKQVLDASGADDVLICFPNDSKLKLSL